MTRPNISFVVRLVSQFMDKPHVVHLEAALKILRYLKGLLGKGFLFKKHSHLKIEAYFDVDYAEAKHDRRFTSGYYTFVRGNLITWHNKKQRTMAQSNAKVEYKAMAHTMSKIL